MEEAKNGGSWHIHEVPLTMRLVPRLLAEQLGLQAQRSVAAPIAQRRSNSDSIEHLLMLAYQQLLSIIHI